MLCDAEFLCDGLVARQHAVMSTDDPLIRAQLTELERMLIPDSDRSCRSLTIVPKHHERLVITDRLMNTL